MLVRLRQENLELVHLHDVLHFVADVFFGSFEGIADGSAREDFKVEGLGEI